MKKIFPEFFHDAVAVYRGGTGRPNSSAQRQHWGERGVRERPKAEGREWNVVLTTRGLESVVGWYYWFLPAGQPGRRFNLHRRPHLRRAASWCCGRWAGRTDGRQQGAVAGRPILRALVACVADCSSGRTWTVLTTAGSERRRDATGCCLRRRRRLDRGTDVVCDRLDHAGGALSSGSGRYLVPRQLMLLQYVVHLHTDATRARISLVHFPLHRWVSSALSASHFLQSIRKCVSGNKSYLLVNGVTTL